MEETEQFFQSIKDLKGERPSYFGVPRHLELMDDTIDDLQRDERFHSDISS